MSLQFLFQWIDNSFIYPLLAWIKYFKAKLKTTSCYCYCVAVVVVVVITIIMIIIIIIIIIIITLLFFMNEHVPQAKRRIIRFEKGVEELGDFDKNILQA